MGLLSDIGGAIFGGGGGDAPGPTSEERELARSGVKNWNRYVRDIVPVSDVYAAQTKASGDDFALINRGVANSARDAGYSQDLNAAVQGNPLSTGAAAMRIQDRSNAADRAVAVGSAQGATQLMDRETRGLLSLASSGRQIKNTGTQTLASAGRDAQRLAIAEGDNDRAFTQGLISGGSNIAGMYVGQNMGG